MPYSTSVDGPFFTSGAISLSSIRNVFGGGSQNISLSGYLRDTNVFNNSPRVPDATENGNIATGRSNVRFSGYRNSIRQYFVTQFGLDINANLSGSPNWNGNLGRNVPKTIFITGTCGSNTTGAFAASFSATAYNTRIDVSGNILGAGGPGGTFSNGNPGGSALFISSSGTAVIVIPRNAIYGGGGGGARGFNGNPGAPGTCFYYTYYNTGNNCGGCPGCGSCVSEGCFGAGGCNCNKKGCRSTNYYSRCRCTVYYGVPGGAGGIGGNGGRGQGYDGSPQAGAAGTPGQVGGCPNLGAPGDPGQPGGSGAGYGGGGEPRWRYGQFRSGGSPGRGVVGGNYVVDNGALGGNAGFILGGY